MKACAPRADFVRSHRLVLRSTPQIVTIGARIATIPTTILFVVSYDEALGVVNGANNPLLQIRINKTRAARAAI
jgi:hypothetical protein